MTLREESICALHDRFSPSPIRPNGVDNSFSLLHNFLHIIKVRHVYLEDLEAVVVVVASNGVGKLRKPRLDPPSDSIAALYVDLDRVQEV